MNSWKLNYILVLSGFSLVYLIFVDANKEEECKNVKCLGPTKFYEELGCQPIFKNPNDCCPERYQCDYFNPAPPGMCIINGHLYNSGEKLREEDKNPCDECTCYAGTGGYTFSCTKAACNLPPARPGCRYGPSLRECCGVEEVCPPNAGDGVSCTVNGITYGEGEEFIPDEEPDKRCYCGKGLTERNLDQYCLTPKHTWCNNVFFFISEIRERCSPIYYYASPQRDCNLGFRCPRVDDEFIDVTNETFDDGNFEKGCQYGSAVLGVGDKIAPYHDTRVDCVKCVCEVPPTPTCIMYSEEDCDAAS